MIINEIVELNNQDFRHTYSDENFYIRKKGTKEIYSDAYDLIGPIRFFFKRNHLIDKNYQYLETDDKIENIGENING